MARKNSLVSDPNGPPKLGVSRDSAFSSIQTRIDKGNNFFKVQINSYEELRKLTNEINRWSDYNNELLTRIFTTSSIANDYSSWGIAYGFGGREPTLPQMVVSTHNDLRTRINRLESIRDRLELIPESTEIVAPQASPPKSFGTGVFVVHGHDDEAKHVIARFVESIGLEAVILGEQTNQGKTIIEKFEEHSNPSRIGFAVILLTPDDIGSSKDKPDSMKPRARQNVVLELGYFMGKLGRHRVCALTKGQLEIPSDYSGVIYIDMQDGSWKISLAREMQSIGLPVDMNKIR